VTDATCGCSLEADQLPTGCSLETDQLPTRLTEWHRMLARAASRDGGRFTFAPSAALVADLARLCAAETECCPFFTFRLEIGAALITLDIDGPAELLAE
jgi:hypothetical protein